MNKLENTISVSKVPQKKLRDSNLELYRIIVMLLIVAHHYVVNSGLMAAGGPIASSPLSFNSIFLLLFGAFGKTGINCFVLITGYFMCKSQITAKKFAKLFGEVVFYDLIFNIIFYTTGYAPFEPLSFIKNILPFTSIAQNFTGCYIVFFLFIPFINILVHKLTQKQHLYLLLLCGFTYVLMGTVPIFSVSMNYVSWYLVLFLIASYIRLYPNKLFDKTTFWGWTTLFFAAVSLLSVIACTWLGTKLNTSIYYAFVSDSNTFLAVATGVSSFMFFKNIKIPYNRLINMFAGSTFGVLLIHAAGDNMRRWLWKDVLDNVGMYGSKLMPLHAIGCVLAIFIICCFIDFLRIKFIEEPSLKIWDKYFDGIKEKFLECERKVLSKLGFESQE